MARGQAAQPAQAGQPWETSARLLAEKIAARAGPGGTLSLTVNNLSSLALEDVLSVRRSLTSVLSQLGYQLLPAPPADVGVRVTLSEGVPGYVWVAEVERGPMRQVTIVLAQRSAVAAGASPRATLILRRAPVWRQSGRVLDFAVLAPAPAAASLLLVLEPERLSFYQFVGSAWVPLESLPIAHDQPWPRDLRGHLTSSGDSFTAYLPGLVCEGIARPGAVMNCSKQANAPWGLESGGEGRASAPFADARNYFLEPISEFDVKETKLLPFFSAAALRSPAATEWVLAGMDGQARLYESSPEPAATFSNWGSDLVSVDSGCNSGVQLIVTGTGDWTEPDSAQAVEILDRQAVPVGSPVHFGGPVTALWSSADARAARAVSRNLVTGEYEVSHLSITCPR